MAHFWIFLLTVSGLGLDASSSVVVSALVVMVRLPVVTRQIPKNIYKGLYKIFVYYLCTVMLNIEMISKCFLPRPIS